MPALGFREVAPSRHPIAQASVGENPEEFSGRGLLDTIRMEVGAIVPALHFALRILAVARRAVLSVHLGAGCDCVRIVGERISADAIFRWNFVQPCSIASSGEADSDQK